VPSYAELQLTSNYSFLRIEELMLQAKALGYDALPSPTATPWPVSPAPKPRR
jgi:hypothetical protein